MVKHSTPHVICMRTDKVNNIISQLKKAMDMNDKATPNDIGCQSLQFASNYTNQVLLDVIADLKRDLDIHDLTFKDYQYDL